MINRRKFLKNAVYTTTITTCLPYAWATIKDSKLGIAIGSGYYINKLGEKEFILSVLDLDSSKIQSHFIKVKFYIHGITVNPINPYIVTLFEKRGPGACEIDLKTGKVIRTIKTVAKRNFYGHGVYSLDASLIYATEANLSNRDGVVTVRDTKTMEIVDHFPTYGKNPHDCMLINNGKTLAITNGGGTKESKVKPSVTYIDIKTKKLLDKVEIQKEDINAGHLSISPSHDLVIVSAPRDGLDKNLPGAISFRPYGKKLTTISEPQNIINKMKSETLSVALLNNKSMVAATSPLGNMISFWNYKTAKFIKAIDIDNPRSIGTTIDQSSFVVGHGKDARISLIDASTFQLKKNFVFPNAGFSGSHLIIWKDPSKKY